MGKTMTTLFIFSVIFLAAFGRARELNETFKKQLPVEDAKRLTLQNRNGNIEVRVGDNDKVEITAYKKVRADDPNEAAELMRELKVIVENRGDEIEVITDFPNRGGKHSHGFWSWVMGRAGSNSGYSVTYEIRVPSHFDLDLESSNGNIEVSGCEGRILAETTNGRIVAEDVGGSLRCSTTNGSITAVMRSVMNEDMHFTSTNGSIKLYLPYDTGAEVSARTTNGSITCDLPIDRTYSENRRTLEAVINKGGPMIYMKTTNGSIRIRES